MQKAQKVRYNRDFRNIHHTNILTETYPTIKQINSSFNNFNDKLLNEANSQLAISFVRNEPPEKAIKILEAVGIDEIAKFVVALLGGAR